jgi:hypothetical protein
MRTTRRFAMGQTTSLPLHCALVSRRLQVAVDADVADVMPLQICGVGHPGAGAASYPKHCTGQRSAPCRDLLHGPAVAVGIVEVDEPTPSEVCDVADVSTPRGQLGVGGFDVVDDQLQAFQRAGL